MIDLSRAFDGAETTHHRAFHLVGAKHSAVNAYKIYQGFISNRRAQLLARYGPQPSDTSQIQINKLDNHLLPRLLPEDNGFVLWHSAIRRYIDSITDAIDKFVERVSNEVPETTVED
ncbi:hypothetical protein BDV28DRAFT_144887 [Aspergillus coremiiformis]|uniref:Uncharacterized protein n=1 Tax=Aspergillus coremiiformis TaxID=138285 RepID=A0A5N6ZGH0_9EURO|nr:hypothetical protein BDV28DRAFT_144887 [Aspergillus coremiiformis]